MPLIIALFVAFTAAAFWLSIRYRGRTVAALRGVASELGYEFLEGGLPAGAALPEDGGARELIAKLAKFLGSWRIVGHAGRSTVNIYAYSRSSGKSSSTYTVVELFYPAGRGGDFQMSREDVFSKIGKALGGQDIEAGDAEFDAKVRVKGADQAAVAALLSSRDLRDAILEALAAYPALQIKGNSMRLERSGTVTDAEYYRRAVDSMSAIAQLLGE
jgi:hypothetical protein